MPGFGTRRSKLTSLLVSHSPGLRHRCCFCAWEYSFSSFVIACTAAPASGKGRETCSRIRTLSVTFPSGIPMLSPALLGGPVREAAWMSELEEAFAWALSLSFYRDGSVSVSEDLYRVSGKVLMILSLLLRYPLAESECSFYFFKSP